MRKERSRPKAGFRNTDGEILFIDARDSGEMVNRRLRELTDDDIAHIAGTYHNWRNDGGDYEDVAGFCARVPVERVAELDYVLTLAATWASQTKKMISTSRSASPHFAPSLSPN